ncbi:CRIB domain-containing protein RIC10-like [Impatiens glandulifera]|uniref:CRIB domain-containing protein RIC10-like n=1 Tax=Impatiens glandulifera TaxID=253017 RepID=UPI001FB0DE14|nr:CRIB domain-containing protein RIC10-like [Impatiens glandulifera]
MSTKIKGIRKGFKYISQIFVVKDRELDIGYPTDVKHVSHIGWDGSTGNAPGWMNEFKTSSDFSTTSIGNIHELRGGSSSIISSTWASQDFESMDSQPVADIFKDTPPMDMPDIPKKQKRKKSKSSSSSSTSTSASSSRSSRATAKLKAKFVDETGRQENREVVL